MSKKTKPKWGWEDAGFFSPFKFSDGDFDKIENKLPNVKLTEDIRKQLKYAVKTYCVEKVRITQNPRLSEVRAALTEIHDKAEALIDLLKQIDAVSLGQLQSTAFPDNSELFNRIEDKSSDIHKLHSIAQETLNLLKQDPGGPKKVKSPLRGLIWHLICIYESSTGVDATCNSSPNRPNGKKYGSGFYDFTLTVLKIINPEEIWSNSSLGQQIKAAIKLLNPSDKENILQSLQRAPTIRD